jgi:hypothetical protein
MNHNHDQSQQVQQAQQQAAGNTTPTLTPQLEQTRARLAAVVARLDAATERLAQTLDRWGA